MRLPLALTPREAKVLERYLMVTLNDPITAQNWAHESRYLNAIKRKLWAAMMKEGVE